MSHLGAKNACVKSLCVLFNILIVAIIFFMIKQKKAIIPL